MSQNFIRPFLAVCAAALLTGCGSSDQFYRLSATAAAPVGRTSDLSVVVGPVSVPAYIDRAELVFQAGDNEFQVPANVRWIGSLQENISLVLATNLGQILHSGRVRSSLETDSPGSYQIVLDIRQFHAISGREAILDVSWRIQNGASRTTLSRHTRSFREPIAGDGYNAVVTAESRLLEQCAEAIAQTLRR